MTIRPGVNLGEAFKKFKTQLQAVTDAKKETGEDYALNFGRLQGASKALLIECCGSDAASEAPTLLLYAQTHWEDEPNDIPSDLFVAPGQFVGEDGIYTAP